FALYKKTHRDGNADFHPESLADTFLQETRFVADFDELHRYYKNTKLLQLAVVQDKLLAAFQIGERLEDIRVFRWALSDGGKTLQYIDNRGERDLAPPPAFDFTWQPTGREHHIQGRHPHINIADTIFVETINGDLTIKIENNTEDGLGIYRELVEDQTQSLDDASIFYAECASLILLKIRPYREETWRYLVFNKLTQDVKRLDALGLACQQLPEQQGIIFPGGYYLQNGEHKLFDTSPISSQARIEFRAMVRSPNGEDVLYEFYEPVSGICCVLTYNIIEKSLQNPIYGHGYALAADGELVIFTAEAEPTRVHPMQIWQTPFFNQEHAAAQPARNTFYGRIGNNELVRGISALFSIVRAINSTSVNLAVYEALLASATKIFDNYFWLKDPQLTLIASGLEQIATTTDLVIDEFEKVTAISQASSEALNQAKLKQQQLLALLQPDTWTQAFEYVNAISQIHALRGQLAALKELRYIDVAQIQLLEADISAAQTSLHERSLQFLQQDKALAPYHVQIATFN
ncbi:MAG: DNA repair protein, partial [Moraxellaceae bacterium]